MKRCILFVVSLILCLCTMNNVAMAALTNEQNIVFLGDSVTSGFFDTVTKVKESFVDTIMNNGYSVSKFAYPYLVSHGLAKVITNTVSEDDYDYQVESLIDSVTVKNAIGSANYVLITTGSDDFRFRADEMFYNGILKSLKISSEDLTTALLKGTLDSGKVDALNNYFENTANNKMIQSTIESFRTNLNTIVQAINAQNPNAKIIIQTIYSPCVGLPENDLSKMLTRLFDTFVIPMNSYIKSVASTNNSVIVADVANAFKVNFGTPLTNVADKGTPTVKQEDYSVYEQFYEDIFWNSHQNAAGDELIAKVLLNILQSPQQSTIVTNEGSSTTNSQQGASVNTLPKTGQNHTMLHMSIIVIFLFAGTTILLIKKRGKINV